MSKTCKCGKTRKLESLINQDVQVSPGAFSLNKIQYYGFHVDDLPHANISRLEFGMMTIIPNYITATLFRHFRRTTDFIQRAVETGGTVCVNCYMGLSRWIFNFNVARKGTWWVKYIFVFQGQNMFKTKFKFRPAVGRSMANEHFGRQKRFILLI